MSMFSGMTVSAATVLIDTWWNVNKNVICYTTTGKAVLIDTWWNVNVDSVWCNCLCSVF